jgi:hypothetical protein
MRHFRFSIRGLMVVIVLLCLAFAALRFPTPLTLISPGVYLRIGHAFFCLLIAFLGGGIVRSLAATCQEPAATERRS